MTVDLFFKIIGRENVGTLRQSIISISNHCEKTSPGNLGPVCMIPLSQDKKDKMRGGIILMS